MWGIENCRVGVLLLVICIGCECFNNFVNGGLYISLEILVDLESFMKFVFLVVCE